MTEEEAVAEMADVFEELAGESADVKQTVETFTRFKEVATKHGYTDSDECIELIISGCNRFFERRRQEAVSDLRQTLEAMQL
jgi:flagellar motor protein MotB